MMKTASSTTRFWQALEAIPGLAAVDAEWRIWFGDDYTSVKPFLRPNGKRASSHPCTEHPGCGWAHQVIEHGPDDIVAVCRCWRNCSTFRLTRSDIALYELDRPAFDRAISDAFNLEGEPEALPDFHQTTRIGVYSPYAGFRFPIYLTIQFEPEDFLHIVEGLLSENDAPFILMAPTRHLCTVDAERVLANRKSAFVPLEEDLELSGRHTLRLRRPLNQILSSFRTAHLPAPRDDDSIIFFATPPGATWSDVSIRFIDGHTVSLQVKSEHRVCNYTQMGMNNRKDGNPTQQWKLLEGFANSRGEIDWHSRSAGLKVKKQKQELSARLRDFFRIEDDPIEWVKDTKGYYKCKFNVLPIGGDEH